MAIGHNGQDDGACIVLNSTITNNNRHLNQKPSVRIGSYSMDCGVPDKETSLHGVKHSVESKGRDNLETNFMKKKKPKNSTKIFRPVVWNSFSDISSIHRLVDIRAWRTILLRAAESSLRNRKCPPSFVRAVSRTANLILWPPWFINIWLKCSN